MSRSIAIPLQLNFAPFWAEALSDASRADEVVDRLGAFFYYHEHDDVKPDEENEEIELLEEELELIVRRTHGRLLLALDVLGADSCGLELAEGWKKYKEKPSALEMTKWTLVVYCPAFEYLSAALRIVASVMPGSDAQKYPHERELARLEQVLSGTAKLMQDRGVMPASEADVRREIFNTLVHFYPDTMREVPIAQVSKIYKPDIGIRSLKAAIEYKFVDSEEEARKFLGGIYEDIHGYSGSSDWEEFFAVVYMTKPFLTAAQVAAEWSLTGVPHNWRPVLVTGGGARRKRQTVGDKLTSMPFKPERRASKKGKGPANPYEAPGCQGVEVSQRGRGNAS